MSAPNLALDQARSEAESLLVTMLDRGENPDAIRSLIRCDGANGEMIQHRRDVLLNFEIELWKHRKRRHGAALPPILRGLVVPLLKAGVSQKTVCERIPVGPLAVSRVAKEIGAAFLKRHGRGRRFSAAFREKIRQAVATGRPSVEIERELHIDAHTVTDMRHELGDREDRRHRKKLSAAQIAEAEKLIRNGRRWRDVAHEFRVSPATLLKRCRYRKRTSWRYFTPAETEAVREAILRGEGKRRIADRLRRPRSSVALLIHRLRKQDPNLPRRAGLLPKVRSAIVAARTRGHSFARIGQRFGLTSSGAFRIVKQHGAVPL